MNETTKNNNELSKDNIIINNHQVNKIGEHQELLNNSNISNKNNESLFNFLHEKNNANIFNTIEDKYKMKILFANSRSTEEFEVQNDEQLVQKLYKLDNEKNSVFMSTINVKQNSVVLDML